MAEKRMFSNKIVNSDSFKEMPLSTQALYFHLGMQADDEGFLNNAKSVQRSILASDDDMKLLIAKRFIIPFDSGVVVIKHWKMNNQIQTSRIKATQYCEERSMLAVKDNKAYTLNLNNVSKMLANCQQNVSNLSASVGIEECSIDKYSIDKCSVVEEHSTPTPHAKQQSIPMTTVEYNDLVRVYGKDFVDSRIERARNYKNSFNYNTIRKWCEEDTGKPKGKNNFNNFDQRTGAINEADYISNSNRRDN